MGKCSADKLAPEFPLKRFLDLLVASTLLILTLPVMTVVALAVWMLLGRPVLLRQIRPGQHGNAFTFYKFRTMSNATNADGHLLPDEERLSSFGRRLRASSLDELPQLFNVLRGDMSLVGPRPLLMDYLPLYSPEQARRHEVRPGITGWAQVNGRNALSWEERFRLDVWYVDHRSFLLDLKILLLTLLRVFQARGISQPGQVTMSRFTGSRK
jgi:lipopolysaccharide/colanic/teichoic acid biosynthesis glycosyltransferase